MSRNAVDPVTTIAQVLAEALRAAAPSNAATPEWRTLAEEARVRGFPSARAFRDWCYRVGVEVKEPGGASTAPRGSVDNATPPGLYCAAMVSSTPPYPTLDSAHSEGGAAGVRALLAWVVAAHPPGVSTLTDAAYALGAATRDDAIRVVKHLRRSAKVHRIALPEYPRGFRSGTPAHAREMARRAELAENKGAARKSQESTDGR